MLTNDQIREVLCYDADRQQVALLFDGHSAGVAVMSLEDAWNTFGTHDQTRHSFIEDLRCQASTQIQDGEITYKAC